MNVSSSPFAFPHFPLLLDEVNLELKNKSTYGEREALPFT